jgi:hypothetical protein
MWQFIPWGKWIEERLQRRAAEQALRRAEWLEEVEHDEAFQRLLEQENRRP